MKREWTGFVLMGSMIAGAIVAVGQTATTPKAVAAPTPLQLQKLGEGSAAPVDPFPPINPKFFTAATPTVDTVNSFIKTMWGYDPNRIWKVIAIQATPAANVSKVTVMVAEKGPNSKAQGTAFFVLPDGKHAIADQAIVPFGAQPFAELRKMLQDRADGPARGAASKDLLLVEFSDLQCPHCKEAQATMDNLVKDFPNARVVYQNFPLVDIHPAAYTAAAYGVCVAEQKGDAFFTYAQAVFDTQAMLTPESTQATLRAAVTKAGMNPDAVATCAALPATKEKLQASMNLAKDAGVDQTPLLSVNGHMVPLTALPYETLKRVVAYQAELDGVNTGAAAAPVTGLKPRATPSLTK